MKPKWMIKEKKDSKDFGAQKMPRSGGCWFAKADSRNEKFLIETKTTIHKRFTVTEALWKKVEKEGLLSRRIPLISVGFDKEIELVVLDKNDFISLIEKK